MTRSKALVVVSIVLMAATGAIAQDPFQVAPRAYKLQFENDWVKVARVHYDPKEKLPAHDHPRAGTVFVYLNNGGPVRFSHIETGLAPFPLVRPPTVAGGFRLARAVFEHHEVENLSELPNDFLRIELKTEPLETNTFQGRFPPEPADRTFQKVAFENAQVRIVRVACAAHETVEIAGSSSLPALLVALGPAPVTLDKAAAESTEIDLGQTVWLEPGRSATLKNRGNRAVQQLILEFKTGPTKADDGAKR
jgi:hypothetical protein